MAVLTTAGSAGAGPMRYGVADDWPKFHACGDVWWTSAADIGYQDVRMTVQWDGSMTIPNEGNLQAAVMCAVLNNVRPILAIYPAKPTLIGESDAAQQSFATFVGLVGQAFPKVTNFIVGNEPNVNRFWQPQYAGGQDAAGKDYEHTLAQAYDALKRVRPDGVVWGPAISSRGNDNANAASNPSHSPVWFIKDMGEAYRASGRTRPVFDEFDLHPYPPVQDTAPFTRPFLWPQAGAADLNRLKQALWDAFHGTAQPLPGEHGIGRADGVVLPIDLDEVGEQTTVVAHAAAYADGPENVAPIQEAAQAARYTQLAQIGACDPDVKTILWFPLIDQPELSTGFQSGQLYADLTRKYSYGAMKQQIASAQGSCLGGGVAGIPRRWVHTNAVVGAAAAFAGPGTAAGSQPRNKPTGIKKVLFSVTATEDVKYTASLIPVLPGARTATGVKALSIVSGAVHAYRNPAIALPARIPDGRYRIRVVVAAALNPTRTSTITSRIFKVGT